MQEDEQLKFSLGSIKYKSPFRGQTNSTVGKLLELYVATLVKSIEMLRVPPKPPEVIPNPEINPEHF